MNDLLTFIFQTYLMRWDNCPQLLLIMFNTEKHHHILDGAQALLKSKAPTTVVDAKCSTPLSVSKFGLDTIRP